MAGFPRALAVPPFNFLKGMGTETVTLFGSLEGPLGLTGTEGRVLTLKAPFVQARLSLIKLVNK